MRLPGFPLADPDPPDVATPRRPTALRQLTVSAPVERVWEVIADPHRLPRWWPGVARVESVEDECFTEVYLTRRGRPMRIDYRVVASEPPWRRAWEQTVVGTPYQRILGDSMIEVTLQRLDEGTLVTLILTERLRGYSRGGRFLVVGTRKRMLEAALRGLAGIV